MGLNILHHKKWNVYNKDNRAKVEKDEAEYAEKQQKLEEKHAEAEREQRHALLLQRARQRHGGRASFQVSNLLSLPQPSPLSDHATNAPLPPSENETTTKNIDNTIQNEKHANKRNKETTPSIQQQSAVQQTKEQHINLFAQEEAFSRSHHPDRLKEEREQKQQRGDIKTQTVDAKFDRQFGFAYGIDGKGENQPWYIQKNKLNNTAVATDDDFGNDLERKKKERIMTEEGKKAQMKLWEATATAALTHAAVLNNNTPVTTAAADDDYEKNSLEKKIDDEKKERKLNSLMDGLRWIDSTSSSLPSSLPSAQRHSLRKEHTKKDDSSGVPVTKNTRINNNNNNKHRHRHRKRDGKEKLDASPPEKKDDMWSALRKERIDRERKEKDRAEHALLARNKRRSETGYADSEKYHSSYGYSGKRHRNR